jgi:hypothetical protein
MHLMGIAMRSRYADIGGKRRQNRQMKGLPMSGVGPGCVKTLCLK